MKTNSVNITMAFLGITILLLGVSSVYAGVPSEPHNANAMWVEPSTINLMAYTVGQKFNITVWVNMSTLISPALGVDGWQILLYYSTTYLKALRAGATEGGRSQLLENFSTILTDPVIESNYVTQGESTLADVYEAVPCYGSLMWIEFNVTAVSPITFPLNITNNDSWVSDNEGLYYPSDGSIAHYNGIVVPEFSSLILVSSLMVLTLVAVALNKKSIRKPKVYQTETSN